ncbi:hypothetical protein [Oceanithermus sp.]|uniref:hypothetical protein n=2 Tax=Oceanithermus sp. TaxID=2268145 RepID=UPI00257D29F6|nr:hypothetical protein [Oceanithermus sp.]
MNHAEAFGTVVAKRQRERATVLVLEGPKFALETAWFEGEGREAAAGVAEGQAVHVIGEVRRGKQGPYVAGRHLLVVPAEKAPRDEAGRVLAGYAQVTLVGVLKAASEPGRSSHGVPVSSLELALAGEHAATFEIEVWGPQAEPAARIEPGRMLVVRAVPRLRRSRDGERAVLVAAGLIVGEAAREVRGEPEPVGPEALEGRFFVF